MKGLILNSGLLIHLASATLKVNGEEGCIFRLQGLSRTYFIIQYEPMMDIKINAVIPETIMEDLIDEL